MDVLDELREWAQNYQGEGVTVSLYSRRGANLTNIPLDNLAERIAAAIAAARAEGHAAGLEDAAQLASIATNAEGDAYERLCCLPDDIRALTAQV